MGDRIADKSINLQLSQIRIHQTFQDLGHSSSSSYLSNQIQRITPEGVSILLSTNPILLENRNDKYFLIAGKRTFDIAITILPANTTIQCKIILTKNQEVIKEIILTDIFLTKCFYSISEVKNIGDIFISINDLKLSDILNRNVSIKNNDELRKLLSKSYNTVFQKN